MVKLLTLTQLTTSPATTPTSDVATAELSEDIDVDKVASTRIHDERSGYSSIAFIF